MSSPKKYSLWLVTKAYNILIVFALLSLSLILGHSFLSQKEIEKISLHLAAPQIAPTAKALPFACPNPWPLRRALVAYDALSVQYSSSLLDDIASRFSFTDFINAYNIAQLKQRNPNFYAVLYNSLSDNYVTGNSAFMVENNWYVNNG